MTQQPQSQALPGDYYGTVYKGSLIVPLLIVVLLTLVLWWFWRRRRSK